MDIFFHIPIYEPQDAFISGMERVYEGRFAQKWSTSRATHTAGIYQQVGPVPQRSRVRFSVWVQVRSGDRNDIDKAQMSGNYQISVGIDPFGGKDHNSEHVVWSPADVFAYNMFRQLHVETIARNNVVTVFLRGEPTLPVKRNDSYWDSACLQVHPMP